MFNRLNNGLSHICIFIMMYLDQQKSLNIYIRFLYHCSRCLRAGPAFKIWVTRKLQRLSFKPSKNPGNGNYKSEEEDFHIPLQDNAASPTYPFGLGIIRTINYRVDFYFLNLTLPCIPILLTLYVVQLILSPDNP